MRVLIAGASGLIGTALTAELRTQGDEVCRLGRSAASSELQWNPLAQPPSIAPIDGFDAVINLAGDGVASGRWNAEKKRRIIDSRVFSTRVLVDALQRLSTPPKVLINASAIGFYGDRGDELLSESSEAGRGFLSESCILWEAEADRAMSFTRVVKLRIGVVLDRRGGALQKMNLPFKCGFGGPVGSGRQYMSWISLRDVVGSIFHLMKSSSLHGAVNLVSPGSVTNAQFATTLGRALHRPAILPLPAIAVRVLLGEMGDALLLSSTRVVPQGLLNSGFAFKDPTLEGCFNHIFGGTRS